MVSVFAKRVFLFFFLPQLDAGEPEQRPLSSRGAIDPPSPQLGLLSSEEGEEEEGRRNAALQVTNSKESSSRDFSLILKMWNPRAQHMW